MATDSELALQLAADYMAAVEQGRVVSLESVCQKAERPDLIGLVRAALADAADVSAAAPPVANAAAPPEDDEPMPDTLGRFELHHELGRGTFGVAFRGRDPALNRDVAVKLLRHRWVGHPANGDRFLDEARITAQLQHPSVPAVYELGTHPEDGRPWMAMKLIKGQTLRRLFDTGGVGGHPLGVFEALCQGLSYAHSKGVVHRDLKPENVMVGAFGEVQIMDWGLAKVLSATATEVGPAGEETVGTVIDSDRHSDGTRAGTVVGSPAYMAPEQAIGAVDKIDRRSDVFGLGGILCRLLTGSPPFVAADSESARQLAALGKVTDAFARLDACGGDPELVALCKRCLAPEREGRPRDAGEVADAVARLREAAERRAREAELEVVRQAEQAKRQRAQRRLVAVLLGVLVAAVGVTVGLARWNEAEVRAVRVNTLVQTLTRAPAAELPTAIGALEPYRPDVAPQLRVVLNDTTAEPRARLNAAVFLGDEPAAVDHMLARLPHLPPAELPPVVAELEPEARRSPGRFWAVVQNTNTDFASRIRHATVLAHIDPDNPAWANTWNDLAPRMVVNFAPGDVGAWANVLDPIRHHLRLPLRQAMGTEPEGIPGFVAIGLLSAFDRDNPSALTELLTRGSPRQTGMVLRALADLPAARFPLAGLTALASRPSGWNPAVHTRHIRGAADAAVAARTAGVIRDGWSPAVHLFVDDTAADPDEPIDRAAESRARAILAILAAKKDKWGEFRDDPDPRVRTYLIHLAAQVELDPALLVDQLDRNHPDGVRAGLLLALGEYPPGRLSPQLLTAASARMIALYKTDPDAGVHSACRWALHRWGKGGELAAIDRDLRFAAPDEKRGWFTTPGGTTFAVVRGPVEAVCGSLPTEWYRDWSDDITEEPFRRLIPRDFAVATTEVTVAEHQRFLAAVADRGTGFETAAGAFGGGGMAGSLRQLRTNLFYIHAPTTTVKYNPTPDCPAAFVSARVAMSYCRWLGEQEGLSEDAQCYPPLPVIWYANDHLKPDFLTRTGYRLPTEAEWEVACRAGTRTRFPFGSDVRLLSQYAWHWPNSPDRAQPVAGLKPNPLGLFDILGNQFERCHGWPDPPVDVWAAMHTWIDDGVSRVRVPQNPAAIRGGSFSRPVGNHRSAFRHGILEFSDSGHVYGDTGFRLARTLRPTTPGPTLTRAELDEVYEFTVGGKGEFTVADPTGPWTVRPKAGTLPATFTAVAPVPAEWVREAVAVEIRCSDRDKPVTVTREYGRRELRLCAGTGDAITVAATRFDFRPSPSHASPAPASTSFTFTDPAKLPPYVLFAAMPNIQGPFPPQWWAYPNVLARPGGPTAFAWDVTARWKRQFLDWRPGPSKDGVPVPPTDDEWDAAGKKPLVTEDRPTLALAGERERPPGLRAGPVGIRFDGELDLPAGVYELAASDRGHRISVGGKVVADTWGVGWRLPHHFTNRTPFRWDGGKCPVRLETYTRGELPFVRLYIRPLTFGPPQSP